MSKNNPGCLATLFGVKPKISSLQIEHFPYRLSTEFFTSAEANFYRILKRTIKEHFLIFPKVSLKEFLFIPVQTNRSEYQSLFNKIDRKHVDFLICSPETLQPVFAIELDDSSHRRASRSERDTFIDSVLSTANLPLVRVPVRAAYNTQELEILFKNALTRREVRVASQEAFEKAEVAASYPPFCPNCGTQMVLRTAKKGINVGEKFWGCPNFPKCKTIIQLT